MSIDIRPSFALDHWVEIPRIPWKGQDSLATIKECVENATPVVLEGAKLMDVSTWSDDNLEKTIGSHTVLVKRSQSEKFRYYDLKKNAGKFPFANPLQEEHMTYSQFLREVEGLEENGTGYLYCQETMSGHEEMAEEFVRWDWNWLIQNAVSNKWGLPESNELFIGMKGATTPCHFDEQENLFFQVRGRKRFVLFPFVDYNKLYPFPVTHPCDRQSMVDVENPDLQRFPLFKEARGHYTVVDSQDLLYIPYGWWHWVKNLDRLPVSMSFWSKTPANDFTSGVPRVFTEHMMTRVRRNLESMISNVNGPEKLPQTVAAMIDAIRTGGCTTALTTVRALLKEVRVADEQEQDRVLLAMFEGRFENDWQNHV
mmetsp:Transcript_14464/g.31327  ORF Transcript_14464/g.31327 Transcript_14464/m.31327 type:complete len:369 (-) Transcript_14464:408-1514(-)